LQPQQFGDPALRAEVALTDARSERPRQTPSRHVPLLSGEAVAERVQYRHHDLLVPRHCSGAKAMRTTRTGALAAALLAALLLTASSLRADKAEDKAARAVERFGG